MKKIFLVVGIVLCMYKLVHAQPIVIPASQFPQVSAPSNDMRFLMVYPPGGLSTNPQLGSNATISYANLVRVLELALTNTSGGGGGGKVSVYSNGVPLVGVSTNINFSDFFTNPSSNGQTATISLGASATTSAINAASNIVANLQSGFQFLITTNMSTAQIQGIFNSMTNSGVVSVQPGNYIITTTLSITNPMAVLGNGAKWSYQSGITNFMLDTGTNYGKLLYISGLRFDGGNYNSYASSNYFHLEPFGPNNVVDPSANALYLNRSGIRAETSAGVFIRDCVFSGWEGQGALFCSVGGGQSYDTGKLLFIGNQCWTNFIGVHMISTQPNLKGYFGTLNTGLPLEPCEYGLIQGNDIHGNYMGVIAGAGNNQVVLNQINRNWIGLCLFAGFNSAHGIYSDNTLNHNNWSIYSQFNVGGIYEGNTMLKNDYNVTVNGGTWDTCGILFDQVQSFAFIANRIDYSSLIFTNTSLGIIGHNVYETNAVWGISKTAGTFTGLYTNINKGIIVSDNMDEAASSHDGSASSIAAFTTNAPFAGAVWVTSDAVHGQWTNFPPSGSGSGSLFPPNAAGVLVNNGSGTTNWLSTNSIINAASSNTLSLLPSQTNFIAFDWSGSPTATNAGLIPVFVGFNAAGDLLVKGTNYPTSGGSTPNGLVTNNGTVTVLVPGLNITNTSPAQSENLFGAIGAVTVPPSVINAGVLFLQSKTNGTTSASSAFAVGSILVQGPRGVLSLGTDVQMLSTNSITQTYQWWDTNNVVHMGSNNVETITVTPSSGTIQGNTLIALGGSVSVIPTNAAPVYTSNGLTAALPFGLTNTLQGRCQYLVGYYIVDAVGGTPILTVSNELDGYKYPPISLGASASITPGTNWFTTPVLSTNTVLRIRDESAGSGASVGLISSKMIGL